MMRKFFRFAAIGAVAMPVAALAASPGVVTTDLNLRAGPGTDYKVISTIPNGAAVQIDGCVEAATWCRVTYNGASGYGSGRYINVTQGAQTVVVTEDPSLVETIVGAPIEAVGTAVGAVAGAVGNIAGAAVDAIDPTDDVTVYVDDNPVQTYTIDGDVVVGTDVPASVELYTVPDYQYSYTNLNGRRVLVSPDTRRVVYVYPS